MEFQLHESFAEFWVAAGPIYRADPVRHTIPLLICSRTERTMAADGVEPSGVYRMLLTGIDAPVAALATNVPGYLLISAVPDEQVDGVVAAILSAGLTLSGVSGPESRAVAFAERWTAQAGVEVERVFSTRLFELGELRPPTGVPGRSRLAVDADASWLAHWWLEFERDTGERISSSSLDELVETIAGRITYGDVFLVWEVDGEPVSWATYRGPVANSARIAPVYTPPEHRGHGYASAVTAAAAEHARLAGAEHVVLYTDVGNPTSNKIYQQIGFRPRHDERTVVFHTADIPAGRHP